MAEVHGKLLHKIMNRTPRKFFAAKRKSAPAGCKGQGGYWIARAPGAAGGYGGRVHDGKPPLLGMGLLALSPAEGPIPLRAWVAPASCRRHLVGPAHPLPCGREDTELIRL
jgi:hypothetical protein